MNPYLNYPYVPQHIEPKIISYTVDSAEQEVLKIGSIKSQLD